MSYRLNIDWGGVSDQVLEPNARLFSLDQGLPGPPQQGQYLQNRFSFENLQPECYLLSLRYVCDGKHFDSCYFQLDLPDITLMKLELKPEGCQLDQMGFVNDQGEFVDMLIYADEKPWLARAVEDYPYLQLLAEFLVFRFQSLTPAEARTQLNQLLGNLAEAFPQLQHLWPYQLKLLIQPAYLAQTTPEWKACLVHLLRNNLILIDDETLYDNLQQAIELAQQQEAVAKLSDEQEWESEAFLKALAGKRMLHTP